MIGEIFNIQKFCVNDGPGIRTTVFLKGCPLSCVWCHNPESQLKSKELMFYRDKCTACGKCKDLSLNDTDFICYNDAKKVCGKTVTSDEIIEEVMKDFIFYNTSGGGITLSGGEPLFQFDFSLDILKKSKEKNLHTAIETCGFTDTDKIIRIASFCDLFLYDFKESDPKKHKLYTGADNCLILKNLFTLNDMKKDIILRCPVISGYNDRAGHFDEICKLANSLKCIREINIEPYHSFGEDKYVALGRNKPQIKMADDDKVKEIITYISAKTSIPVTKA